MSSVTAIERAVEVMDGGAALARSVGVSRAMVFQWRKGVRQISAEKCIAIEHVTDGEVRCEDLRPDVNWAVLRGYRKVSRGEAAGEERSES